MATNIAYSDRLKDFERGSFVEAVEKALETGVRVSYFLETGDTDLENLSLLPEGEAYFDNNKMRNDDPQTSPYYGTGVDRWYDTIVLLREVAKEAPEGWFDDTNCPNLLDRLLKEEPINWKSGPYWGKEYPKYGVGWSAAYVIQVRYVGEPFSLGNKEMTEDEAIRLIFG